LAEKNTSSSCSPARTHTRAAPALTHTHTQLHPHTSLHVNIGFGVTVIERGMQTHILICLVMCFLKLKISKCRKSIAIAWHSRRACSPSLFPPLFPTKCNLNTYLFSSRFRVAQCWRCQLASKCQGCAVGSCVARKKIPSLAKNTDKLFLVLPQQFEFQKIRVVTIFHFKAMTPFTQRGFPLQRLFLP